MSAFFTLLQLANLLLDSNAQHETHAHDLHDAHDGYDHSDHHFETQDHAHFSGSEHSALHHDPHSSFAAFEQSYHANLHEPAGHEHPAHEDGHKHHEVKFGSGNCYHCGGKGYSIWPSSQTKQKCWYCDGSGVLS